MDSLYSIKSLVIPYPDNIIKAKLDERLGQVLAKTKSSHEGVFVFDEQNNFVGLVSPYQAFFFERYPYHTHIKKCMVKPPRITMDTPLYDVAEFMMFMEIYNLPVLDESGKVKFVITANKIFAGIAKNKELIKQIENVVNAHEPITVNSQETAIKVYSMMQRKKVSRIIVVDREGDLAGIVSRRDIEDAIITKTPRARFRKKFQVTRDMPFFDQEEIKRLDGPISMFYTKKTVTAQQKATVRVVLEKMNKARVNSLVLVDGLKPVGFVSRHDFLKALVGLRPKKRVQVIWEDAEGNVGQYTRLRSINILENFATKYSGNSEIRRMEIHLDVIKNAAGYNKMYYIRLKVDFKSGKRAYTQVETRDVITGTRRAIKRIENQFDLSDRQKHSRI